MRSKYLLTDLPGKTALLFTLIGIVSMKTVCASENINFKSNKYLKKIEFSKSLKIRGFQISNGVYMGQAKVAGKYGFGVVVDRKSYSWGINNQGISILKRF